MNKKGFTLIELLGVIIILGILAAIGTVSYYKYLDRAKSKSFVMAEKTLMNNAKNAYADCLSNSSSEFCKIYSEYDSGESIYITLGELIDYGYSDKIKNPYDTSSYCDINNSYVVVDDNGFVGNNKDISYQVCLICGEYKSDSVCDVVVDTKRTDTITFTAKNAAYTGSPIVANTATATSGTKITYTYYSSTNCSGNSLSGAPTNAGNYSVKATSAGNDYYKSGSKCVTHTINKKSDTVSLAAKSATYTGSAISANTATATSGTKITYTYYSSTDCSGNSLSGAPTNAGNYSVKATSAGNSNYSSGSKCVTHTIKKDSNAYLSSLSVSGYSISPSFSATIEEYTVTTEAMNITINATAVSSLSMVTGTGSKDLSWGSDTKSVIVTAQNGDIKTYKITVKNQQPTAPVITGGSSNWVATAPTITVSTAGTALSGVKHYEYYMSTSSTAPTGGTMATATTAGGLAITTQGTNYIWYRTVSNNGYKSAWTSSYQVVKIDTTNPTVKVAVKGKIATLVLSDNLGLAGYGVNQSTKIQPTSYISVSGISATESWPASKAGMYVVWIKDIAGRTNYEEFIIESNAFDYAAVDSSYAATASSSGNCSEPGGYCTDGGSYCVKWGNLCNNGSHPDFTKGYDTVCRCGKWVNSGTTYSCPNGGTLSGTTCILYTCPDGGILSGTRCIR